MANVAAAVAPVVAAAKSSADVVTAAVGAAKTAIDALETALAGNTVVSDLEALAAKVPSPEEIFAEIEALVEKAPGGVVAVLKALANKL